MSLILTVLAGMLLAACGNDNSTVSPPATATASVNKPEQVTTTTQATATATPLPTVTPSPLPSPTPSPVAPTPTTLATTALAISPGPAVVGDLPAPLNSRKLNLSAGVLRRLQTQIGGRYTSADTGALATAVYASPDFPADVSDYYRAAMQAKGWTESHTYDNRFGIYFVKGSLVAAIGAVAIPDETTIDFLAGFVPEIKGQLRAGESIIALAQGPSQSFEVIKKK